MAKTERPPANLVEAIEREAELPSGSGERFSGYGVMGMPFRSGHVLGMRRFPASSIGPGYRSVWHRDPDGRWTFYQDQPAELACSRYFGDEVDEVREGPIRIDWTGSHRFEVHAGDGALEWEVELGSTPVTRLFSTVGSALPARAWRSRPVLALMSRVAGPALRAGRVRLTGLAPNGQRFVANPLTMWVAGSNLARIGGVDLGEAGPAPEQAKLRDFAIPQRGLFVLGNAVFTDPIGDPETAGRINGNSPRQEGRSRMTTTERQLDTADLTERVKGMYQEVALHPDHEFHFETGRPLAERLGYPAADLDRIPAAAIDSFAGVGYFLDLAAIAPGEAVLDLGSGSGTDAFLAALAAGEAGSVVGVDMTAEQLDKATDLAADAGIANAEFRKGQIENPPVDPASIDCVISNGVINLPPDKPAVFAAAAAALRPGGRLAIADIVSAKQLPEGVTCDASLWAACIGGAMQRERYLESIEAAGFEVLDLRENEQYRFISDRADNATRKYGVTSISLRARRR
jgi:arsenite methyltransferase